MDANSTPTAESALSCLMVLGVALFVMLTQSAVVKFSTPSIGSLSAQLAGLAAGFIHGTVAWRAFHQIAVRERTMNANDVAAMIYRPMIFPFWMFPCLVLICIRYPFVGSMILCYVAVTLSAITFVQMYLRRLFSWLVCTIYGACLTVSIPAVGGWFHVLVES